MSASKIDNNNEMHFLDHLEELRWRIIKILIGVVIGSVIVGIFIDFIITNILLTPAKNTEPPMSIINLKPYGQLTLYFEVILIGGLVVSMPNVFYQFWKFVEPALKEKEKKYIVSIVFFSTLCFLTGIAFIYYVLLPTALKFFATFGSVSISNQISIEEYLSFVISLLITGGVVFELPMISYFLGRIGILKPSFMRKYRRHAIVIILLLAGILTPGPDVTSQILLAVPLFVLYEISILLCKFAQKQKLLNEQKDTISD